MKLGLLLALVLSTLFTAFADSPLTSTPFHTAYKEVKMVQEAQRKGMTKKVLKFLTSSKTPSVEKLAVCNALGWGDSSLVIQFEKALLKQRKGLQAITFHTLRQASEETPEEDAQTRLLTSDDLMCWSYLQALGNYFNPFLATKGSFFAYLRNPSDMAIATTFALIGAQIYFDVDWCNVYLICNELLVETTYTSNQLKAEALVIIMEYINLYAASCAD